MRPLISFVSSSFSSFFFLIFLTLVVRIRRFFRFQFSFVCRAYVIPIVVFPDDVTPSQRQTNSVCSFCGSNAKKCGVVKALTYRRGTTYFAPSAAPVRFLFRLSYSIIFCSPPSPDGKTRAHTYAQKISAARARIGMLVRRLGLGLGLGLGQGHRPSQDR